jgi:hypothetical protein
MQTPLARVLVAKLPATEFSIGFPSLRPFMAIAACVLAIDLAFVLRKVKTGQRSGRTLTAPSDYWARMNEVNIG